MEKDIKNEEDNMKARLEIWQAALEMCNTDKQAYKDELNATHHTI